MVGKNLNEGCLTTHTLKVYSHLNLLVAGPQDRLGNHYLSLCVPLTNVATLSISFSAFYYF